MKKVKISVLIIAALFVFLACNDSMKPVEYLAWVENAKNKLKINKHTKSADYELQYEPTAYKAIKVHNIHELTGKKFRTQKKSFQQLSHFLLQVKFHQKPVENERDVSEYLAFDYKDRIRLVSQTDTLDRTALYHLESSSSIYPYHKILFAYPRKSIKGSFSIILDKNKLDNEQVIFRFSGKNIKKAEKININIQQEL